MKRGVAVLCAAIILGLAAGSERGAASPAPVPAFSDIGGHPAELELSILCALGVFQGPQGPGGPVKPDSAITREEFCKVVAEGFGYGDEAAALAGQTPDFSDGTAVAPWAWGYVNAAVSKGIIHGYEDGTFRPKRDVTRAEAVAMLIRCVDNHEAWALTGEAWPANYVFYGVAHGFTGAVDMSDPSALCLRGDMARMLVAALRVDALDESGVPSPGAAVLVEGQRLRSDCVLAGYGETGLRIGADADPIARGESFLLCGASNLDECVGSHVLLVLDDERRAAFLEWHDGWSRLPEPTPVSLDGTRLVSLPPGVARTQVDGVVVADPAGGGFVPVRVGWSGDRLAITPVDPYRRACAYSLRVFLADGRCLGRSFVTERYPTLDVLAEQVVEVAACPADGFNYPYLLFVPPYLNGDAQHRLLVEPDNTGFPSDSLEVHLSAARQLVEVYPPRHIAETLNVPLLVPVFPRPMSRLLAYTHALNRETLQIPRADPLCRIDLQLLAMIRDAKKLLAENGILVKDKVFLDGFSASGQFVNRFAILHPEAVRAVASGGVSGLPTFPTAAYGGKALRYPVGIADLTQMTGITFDGVEYGKVAQLIYMGATDTNDTLPFRDSYEERDADLLRSLCGSDMMGRWAKSQEIYGTTTAAAQFVTYPGVGHQIGSIYDLITFFRINDNDGEGLNPIQPTLTPGGSG